ncbi:hypothetical protein QBC98_000168 [Kitasatospora acidiphila]
MTTTALPKSRPTRLPAHPTTTATRHTATHTHTHPHPRPTP